MKMICVGGPAAGQSFGELLPDEPAPERYIYPHWPPGWPPRQEEYIYVGVGQRADSDSQETFAVYVYAGPWHPGGQDDTTAAIQEGDDDGQAGA